MNKKKIYRIFYFLLLALPAFSKCSEPKVDMALLPMMFVHVDSITMTSAVLLGSNNHSQGSGKLFCTELGFYWSSTSANPSEKDNKILLGSGSGYQFKANLTGLKPGTVYYVKSFAVNSYGSNKSLTSIFTTLSIK